MILEVCIYIYVCVCVCVCDMYEEWGIPLEETYLGCPKTHRRLQWPKSSNRHRSVKRSKVQSWQVLWENLRLMNISEVNSDRWVGQPCVCMCMYSMNVRIWVDVRAHNLLTSKRTSAHIKVRDSNYRRNSYLAKFIMTWNRTYWFRSLDLPHLKVWNVLPESIDSLVYKVLSSTTYISYIHTYTHTHTYIHTYARRSRIRRDLLLFPSS